MFESKTKNYYESMYISQAILLTKAKNTGQKWPWLDI